MALYSDDFVNFKEYKSSFSNYTLGNFSTYSDASLFKSDIVKLGFEDAYLVAFYKTEQIDIEQALELSEEHGY